MKKQIKLKEPEENVVYTIAMPPTGKLVKYKFIKKINNGARLALHNVETLNVVTLTPARFSYLISYCLVEKEKIKPEERAPSVAVSEK